MNIMTNLHAGSMSAVSMNSGIMSDAMSEPSSPESNGGFDDSDLLHSAVNDEVTAQLANAGPIGMAAAAAIATGKKRKRPHSFETNPSVRKRQQTRLLRKLRATIEEYTTRVGQQAIVLSCTPGKCQQPHAFRVFGSQPLENVIRSVKSSIMQELESSLAQQAPTQQHDTSSLHELPPLNIDGIPTAIDKMTQAQLRAFIPEMLKYSTGRSKPGWGKQECRPVWWPDDVPWANVRSDVRSEEQKKKVSWTHALRTIVRNCYKHHGRDDLLPDYMEDSVHNALNSTSHFTAGQTMVQTITNSDGSVSIIQIDTGADQQTPQLVTLADGTQAHVVHQISNGVQQQEATQAVQTLADVAASQNEMGAMEGNPTAVSVEMQHDGNQQGGIATLSEATINADGQLVLAGEVLGMVTIPVSMYQTVVTNIAQLNEAHQQQLQQGVLQNVSSQPAPVQMISQTANTPLAQVIPPGLVTGQPLISSSSPATSSDVVLKTEDEKDSSSNSDVPDATQAVEVMTAEQS